MPGGSDVGANIRELNASKTKRPMKQKVAIALSEARRAGTKSVGSPPKKTGVGEDKWIQGAIKKPGALHEQLGVPQGKKIPAKKLSEAASKGGKIGQRARLAQTLGKMRK
jgi:hypothetical protein